MLFTVGLPVVLFLLVGSGMSGDIAGVSARTWYMVNMAVFGSVAAVLGAGARIAVERDAGWTRQLRLTPLPPLGYVGAKVATGMLVALPAFLLVCLAGWLSGQVRMTSLQWGQLIVLSWLALLPLAVVGVGIGYLARGDSAQAVNGGVMLLLSMLGGLWFPLEGAPGWLVTLAHDTPTYWIAQIGRAPLTHEWPTVGGYVVLGGWAVLGARIAAKRYRYDTVRAA